MIFISFLKELELNIQGKSKTDKIRITKYNDDKLFITNTDFVDDGNGKHLDKTLRTVRSELIDLDERHILIWHSL